MAEEGGLHQRVVLGKMSVSGVNVRSWKPMVEVERRGLAPRRWMSCVGETCLDEHCGTMYAE